MNLVSLALQQTKDHIPVVSMTMTLEIDKLGTKLMTVVLWLLPVTIGSRNLPLLMTVVLHLLIDLAGQSKIGVHHLPFQVTD